MQGDGELGEEHIFSVRRGEIVDDGGGHTGR